jgi:limonene-1,2-epoxide hydrolase
MAIDLEASARELIADFEGPRLGAEAIDRILDRFAPDGVYHVFAWEEPHVGRDAIRTELTRQADLFGDASFDIVSSARAGDTVFLQRIDWVTMRGKRLGLHVVGVFEFDDSGRLTSWRDYLDSREIAAKLR